jgi:hypothetical protein
VALLWAPWLAALLLASQLSSRTSSQPGAIDVVSPDGQLRFELQADGRPVYHITYRRRPLIGESGLGLILEGAPPLTSSLRLRRVLRGRNDASWRPTYGERAVIPDRYNDATIDLEETIPPRRTLRLEVRAYDEGIAFRYDPALTFFDHVPTVWDETRVADGRPGQYAVVARRTGERWFLGAITNAEERTLSVPLDFLPARRTMLATIYADGDQPRRAHVAQRPVSAADRLDLRLAANGGAAVEITPR